MRVAVVRADTGTPIGDNFFNGAIPRVPGATNLGLLAGLHGAWSLLPPALMIVSFFVLACRLKTSRDEPIAR